jgi:hypothetical protein
MRKALWRRLSPKFDEFEEDIIPRDVCIELGACSESVQSLDAALRNIKSDEKKEEKDDEDDL